MLLQLPDSILVICISATAVVKYVAVDAAAVMDVAFIVPTVILIFGTFQIEISRFLSPLSLSRLRLIFPMMPL